MRQKQHFCVRALTLLLALSILGCRASNQTLEQATQMYLNTVSGNSHLLISEDVPNKGKIFLYDTTSQDVEGRELSYVLIESTLNGWLPVSTREASVFNDYVELISINASSHREYGGVFGRVLSSKVGFLEVTFNSGGTFRVVPETGFVTLVQEGNVLPCSLSVFDLEGKQIISKQSINQSDSRC